MLRKGNIVVSISAYSAIVAEEHRRVAPANFYFTFLEHFKVAEMQPASQKIKALSVLFCALLRFFFGGRGYFNFFQVESESLCISYLRLKPPFFYTHVRVETSNQYTCES